MRAADVKVGETYLTRVSGELVPVRIVRSTTIGRLGKRRGAFIVARVDGRGLAGFPLPKPRTAAALRPEPEEQGEPYEPETCEEWKEDPWE